MRPRSIDVRLSSANRLVGRSMPKALREIGTVEADVWEAKTTAERIDEKFGRLETRVETIAARLERRRGESAR